MKYRLLLIIILSFLNLATGGNTITHEAYSSTGHDQFSYLAYNNTDYCILKDYNEAMINKGYSKVKKTAFGWGVYMEHEYENATYIGAIVFSRSNKTLSPFKFDYSLSEVVYEEQSYAISGSITLKQTAKLKKVELGGNESIEVQIQGESSIKTTESNSLSITVNPNKKITLRITGDAKISLCFAKYYFFGICTKRGVYECVDVVTSFYELYEEDV